MGRRPTKSGKVRLAEVAERAGVSPITASRFFRNPEALSIAKRARVESAAKELGYVPNLAARALASQRTEVIAVLIPSLANNVFSDVLRGIYDASEGSRHSIQLSNTRYSILEEEKLLRLFLAQKPAGLIITGIDQTTEARAMLKAADCPIVQIMEIGPDPIDMMIGFSHYEAARAAWSPRCAGLPQNWIHRSTHGSAGAATAGRLPGRHEGGLAVRCTLYCRNGSADLRHARRHPFD